jgi:type IV pilus assembly protein PilA
MRTGQKGFSLVEVLIVIAVIGLLTSLAIPAYQSYLVRAQVAEGLALAAPLKNAIATFYNNNGAFPADNIDASVEAAADYSGKYVDSISVTGAAVEIRYGNDASAMINGQTVRLAATIHDGSVEWSCTSGGFIQEYYLPAACR